MSDWRKDHAEYLRIDSARFARYAAAKRQEAIDLRKHRRFVEALTADVRAREYREARDSRKAASKRLLAGGPL